MEQIIKKMNRLDQEITQLEARLSINQSKLQKAKKDRDHLEQKAVLEILKKHRLSHTDLTKLLDKTTQENEKEQTNETY